MRVSDPDNPRHFPGELPITTDRDLDRHPQIAALLISQRHEIAELLAKQAIEYIKLCFAVNDKLDELEGL